MPLAKLASGKDGLGLLDDVLFLVRTETGEAYLQNLAFDPSSMINGAIQQHSPAAETKGLFLYFSSENELPELIATDPVKLTRILGNLIEHGIDQATSGRILLQADFDSDLAMLSLEVTHPGGIDDATQLFDVAASKSDLATAKRLRLAICQRLAQLLGGDLTATVTPGQETSFSLVVKVNEIKAMQSVLPSGQTLEEFITTAESAQQLSEARLADLQQAVADASSEAARRSELEARLTQDIDELRAALNDAESQAASDASKRAERHAAAESEIEALGSKLAEARTELTDRARQLANEQQQMAEAESAALGQVRHLEQELSRVQDDAARQTRDHRQAEETVRQDVRRLTEELQSAQERQVELNTELKDQQTDQQQTIRLEHELTSAQEQLASEQRLHAQATEESEDQVRSLLSQLQQARDSAERDSQRLLQQIDQLNHHVQSEKADAVSDLEAKLRHLEDERENLAADIVGARSESESLRMTLKDDENAAQKQLDALQAQLDIARQQAVDEASQRENVEASSHAAIEALRSSLAEASLTESASRESALRQSDEELAHFRTALATAEENLANERTRRDRADERASEQISALMDEINEARTTATRETRAREQTERANHELLQSIEQELAGARDDMARETATREQSEEQLRTATEQLGEARSAAQNHARTTAMAREQLAQMEEQLAAVAGDRQRDARVTEELEQTRREAQNYARAEALAREQLAQLEQRFTALQENSQIPSHRELAPVPTEGESDAPTIRSTLSTSNPVMRTMIERFLVRLSQQLELMVSSCEQQRYLDLVVICDWLKGEAQNLGFPSFIEPTHSLEVLLRNQSFDQIPASIDVLQALAWKIELDDSEPIVTPDFPFSQRSRVMTDTAPIWHTLPANERKAELLENFISQLGTHLMEMQEAWQQQDVAQLAKNCKWIAKYSTKMDLRDVTYATEDLQEAMDKHDSSDITARLLEFINLYTRIKLVHAVD